MANHVGSEGSVYIGANAVAEIKSWSLEVSMNTVSDTSIGDSWETFKAGTLSWSGSIECHWDETDTNGQIALNAAVETPAAVTLNLYPEGNSSTDIYYTGSAYITGISRSGTGNEIISATYSFTGTGSLTESTVA